MALRTELMRMRRLPRMSVPPLKRYNVRDDIVHNLLAGFPCGLCIWQLCALPDPLPVVVREAWMSTLSTHSVLEEISQVVEDAFPTFWEKHSRECARWSNQNRRCHI